LLQLRLSRAPVMRGMKRPDHGGFAGGSFGPRISTDYLKPL
jgi:hypothetical protein